MAHPKGTYLGGIRTVEDLRCRCRIDEETGCWHWGLAIVQGVPSIHLTHPATGEKLKTRGRRAALILARGRDLPKGHSAFATSNCTSTDCVNPEHCAHGNRDAAGRALAKSGVLKGLPSKIAAAKLQAERRRKLSPEAIADIRSSNESDLTLARRHGVSTFAVWACRTFKTHRPQGASVFSLAGKGALV